MIQQDVIANASSNSINSTRISYYNKEMKNFYESSSFINFTENIRQSQDDGHPSTPYSSKIMKRLL